MRQIIFIFFSFFILNSTHAKDCTTFLNLDEVENVISNTERFISFLGNLVEEGVLQDEFIETLAMGHFTNPFASLQVKSEHVIYQPLVDTYLSVNLDKEKIQQWAIDILTQHKKVQKNKDQTAKKTKSIEIEKTFNLIEPGEFMMGPPKDKKLVKIDKAFEMMNTLMTQLMWAKITIAVGITDRQIIRPTGSHEQAKTYNIYGHSIALRAEYPIYWFSIGDVYEVLDIINNMSLQPDKQPILQELFPGHQLGDIYQLPSSEQWEFVMRNRGKANGEYFDRNDDSKLQYYAHYEDNTPDSTIKPVGELLPRIVDGNKKFYDLEGNASELTSTGSKDGGYVTRGGSVRSKSFATASHHTSVYKPGGAVDPFLCFRLIRMRK